MLRILVTIVTVKRCMPKYTTEQIHKALEGVDSPLVAYYLRLELERRSKAGRKVTGQAMTGAERVARWRENKSKKSVDK